MISRWNAITELLGSHVLFSSIAIGCAEVILIAGDLIKFRSNLSCYWSLLLDLTEIISLFDLITAFLILSAILTSLILLVLLSLLLHIAFSLTQITNCVVEIFFCFKLLLASLSLRGNLYLSLPTQLLQY